MLTQRKADLPPVNIIVPIKCPRCFRPLMHQWDASKEIRKQETTGFVGWMKKKLANVGTSLTHATVCYCSRCHHTYLHTTVLGGNQIKDMGLVTSFDEADGVPLNRKEQRRFEKIQRRYR